MRAFLKRLAGLRGTFRGMAQYKPVPVVSPRTVATTEGRSVGAPVVGNGARGVASLGTQDTAASVTPSNPLPPEGAGGMPAQARVMNRKPATFTSGMPMVSRRSPGTLTPADPPKDK